ncbi:pyridoxal phosphate-dependent aminotransferase [Bradyrhizobium sp. CCGB12]|uniref:pyridoxal phosphate-dependent aminotransferase n=1 Tax=Bradyrhizobium sp. CCGB12 TaxID=2949632 RepID=UPI0020B2DA7C|nr:pyridoxal phosphate-dependent aminotransferase [Bradyrhizobium sp. CCGB12]MCP3394923.1 pyridoxal phosphate-dependent aminotransferase [Bradyrhizobium sp. CCGB12]
MLRFELEDFFDEYEHQTGLINLASSDAAPWSASALDKEVLAELAGGSLGYPNPKRLLGSLERALAPPAGIGLLPTSGAAEAIALAIHEIAKSCSPPECLLALPSPSYGAFRGLASLLGIKTKQYDYRPGDDWQPDLDDMCALASECSAFILNNPHNPSGYVICNEHLERIAEILASRGAVLIVDEVFRFPDEMPSAIELRCDVVVLGSLSKTHGLPGLRLGWIAARPERLARYRTLQQYLSLTLNSFSVAIGCSVFEDLARFDRAGLVRTNRRLVIDWARRLRGLVSISAPSGGTTVCVAVDGPISEEMLFKASLDAGILIAPGGRCFGPSLSSAWFRLGYGTETSSLELGLERLENVIRDRLEKVN